MSGTTLSAVSQCVAVSAPITLIRRQQAGTWGANDAGPRAEVAGADGQTPDIIVTAVAIPPAAGIAVHPRRGDPSRFESSSLSPDASRRPAFASLGRDTGGPRRRGASHRRLRRDMLAVEVLSLPMAERRWCRAPVAFPAAAARYRSCCALGTVGVRMASLPGPLLKGDGNGRVSPLLEADAGFEAPSAWIYAAVAATAWRARVETHARPSSRGVLPAPMRPAS